jgi:tRNA A37 threonylcarbamoyladenosine dehydratase
VSDNHFLSRFEILVGKKVLTSMAHTKVLLLGIGGVGSWCAEALIRNGIGHLTMVDFDKISVTNINRQLHALQSTIGKSKVHEMKKRLLDINPHAEIVSYELKYKPDTADKLKMETYDFIIDAIDTLSAKVNLLEQALKTDATVLSSMGAGRKLDPAKIQKISFWKTKGCPLAKFVRKKLRNRGVTKDFMCVFSPENLTPFDYISENNSVINGSSVHVTGIFGLFLAGMVTQKIIDKTDDTPYEPQARMKINLIKNLKK